MEKAIDRFLTLRMAVSGAAFTALSLAYIAHYDFGYRAKRFGLPPWLPPLLLPC
jgi:hypothetical protein